MSATEYVEAPEPSETEVPTRDPSRFAEFVRDYDIAKLVGRMDYERRVSLESWTLDLYRLIEATPDDEAADPRLVHALQHLYCATQHIQDARHALLPIAADRGHNNSQIL